MHEILGIDDIISNIPTIDSWNADLEELGGR